MAATYGVRRALGHTVTTLEQQIADMDRQALHPTKVWEWWYRLQGELDEARDPLGKHDFKTHTERMHEQRDKPGRLLAWLVNREQGRNAGVSIKNAQGAFLTMQKGILCRFLEFYTQLYAQTDQDNETGIAAGLDEAHIPTVNAMVWEALNTTIEESDGQSSTET
ncbi:hypothetical protein NDU88_005932 [Pleurodeles waltl]|uniref:Uncharacterized protein n=1 Tax=Pleurodeles waltl TaxID=8319 RepID=A0AAV7SN26_PLEWA|nr:hypothetical protein NDU88_005932 [Pleurodeles waltl]